MPNFHTLPKIEYLGHVIASKDLELATSKVAAIVDVLTTQNSYIRIKVAAQFSVMMHTL